MDKAAAAEALRRLVPEAEAVAALRRLAASVPAGLAPLPVSPRTALGTASVVY